MKTKKLLFGFGLGVSLLGNFAAHAQSGLEGIIVEKYYRANAADASAAEPVPAGTETYRIYVDLADGYQLQGVYGDATHMLKINTTTTFWNNTNFDAYKGTNTASQLKNSTIALDSWITLGGAASGNNIGVLKAEDNGAANLLLPHNPTTVLANAPASIGIPLTTQDGMIAMSATPAITIAGIDPLLQRVFYPSNTSSADTAGFETNNGAWATTDLDTGATASNRVLIAQLTTNGVLSFMLNLQIKNISTSVVEKWVPSSPGSGEYALAALSQTGIGAPPTVSITSPANASNAFIGNPINITGTSADADGTVSTVDIYLNGALKGTATGTAPFTYTISGAVTSTLSAGTYTLTAKATDNDGNVTTSSNVTVIEAVNAVPTVTVTAPANNAVVAGALGLGTTTVNIAANVADSDGSVDSVQFLVGAARVGSVTGGSLTSASFAWVSSGVYGAKTITVKAFDNNGAQGTSSVNITITNPNAKPYFVDNTDTTCILSSFCLPIKAKDSVKNVIGFDFVLHYDKTKVNPTGVVTPSGDMINASYVTVSNSINSVAGTIYISVSLNNTAPNNTFFTGNALSEELVCVGFNKVSGFASIDTAVFSIDSIIESRYTGVTGILVDAGKYITHRDSTFHASLVFWADNSPIQGGAGHLATDIKATYVGATTVNPDASGNFSYVVSQSQLSSMAFNITRDVYGDYTNTTSVTSVQSVVNGFDALLAKKVVMQDPSFVPSVFQILAMDVNQDGVISAGDITQINQRSVLLIPEYKQAWNYSAAGVSNGQPSRDWVFIDGTTLSTNGTYLISSVYPAADGAGYTKDNVPVPATNIAAAVTNAGSCPVISNETYTGVMLGDVNGNYKSIPSSATLRDADTSKIILDLTKAIVSGNYMSIPVTFASGQTINALDLALQLEASLVNPASYANAMGNFNADDSTLRVTSYSMQNFVASEPVFYVQVPVSTGEATVRSATTGYLNGEQTNVEVIGNSSNNTPSTSVVSNSTFVSAYPNPAGETLNIVTSEDATVELFDINGIRVLTTSVSANQALALNTANLAAAVYTLKVYNATTISVSKIVIAK